MPSPSALLLQLFRLQEEERARVGRALHNQVGQALSAIRMGAHLVQSEDDADLRAEDLHEIIRASDETVAILRDLHAHLHPPQLDAIGLDAALRAEVERHFAPGTLSVSLPPLPRAPQADLALVAFRIGQALLRQAATRADGGAQVTLTDDDDAFVLSARHIPGDVPDAALWRALASAAGGRLDDEGGSHWRLRLPYGSAPATSPDPA
ncbi:sensor histidine kinase [Pseudoxanthomonas mexicana]|uniref:sensor histidine kinase n=1 Tax=Pseudoxanthomonas mexicana TaxID=128785 RepID=UPI0022F38C69|nr:histidine kinase [Pseudoxanthomonas mexicana]WBX92917.1 histidine kinase [Pseudoxanthomonas mexicana]